jgi:hypothetical protein
MMRIIQATHREEDGLTAVSLLFKGREQLFDPGDPSPAAQQELTGEAEASILSNFDAVPLKKQVRLEILLPESPDPASVASVPEAIRYHFRFLLGESERDWRIFLRERRMSLAFAVVNILIGLLYIDILSRNESLMTTLWGIVAGTIIVILNWATIWDTYEFFIYDGRQRRHRMKLLEKIAGAGIRVVPV